jgi:hypothetical protein
MSTTHAKKSPRISPRGSTPCSYSVVVRQVYLHFFGGDFDFFGAAFFFVAAMD